MLKEITLSFFALSFLSGSEVAIAALPCAGAHTWHNLQSHQGTWEVQLTLSSEGNVGRFISNAPECKAQDPLTVNVSPQQPQQFGFSFLPGADFDIGYTLVAKQKSPSTANYQAKTCVFVVSAKGPANPDIAVLPYNGAVCNYAVTSGVGEDYFVG
jgi:hypothetical protein